MTTALSLPPRLPVLAEAALPRLLTRAGVSALGTALPALAAQAVFPIPGSPVPATAPTFAVLLTAASLGPTRGKLVTRLDSTGGTR
jgi:biotin transport system substrate-specific component